MNNFILILIFTGSAVLNVGLAAYGWRRRRHPGAMMFSLAAVLFMVWPLAQAIDLTTSDLSLKIILMKSRLDAPVFGGIAWLVMVTQLTGQPNLLKRRHLAIICSVPILTLLLNLTSYSEFFRHSYYITPNGSLSILRWTNGPLFWVWFLWGYAVFIAPFFILIRAYQNISTLSAQQGYIVLLALAFPLIVNLLFQFGLTPINGLNLTPAVFSISGMLIAWAVFRYHLFNIIPVARGLLIENMSDGVIVLDNHKNIVDINPAMLKLTGIERGAALGKDARTVFAPWPDILDTFLDVNETQTEISTGGHPKQFFDLRISPLYGQGKWEAGQIVVVRDVTRYKQVEMALRTSEKNFRQMLEAAPDAMLIVNRSGNITFINAQCVSLFGYAPDELIHEPVEILLPASASEIHKEHRDGYFHNPKARAMGNGQELIGRRKDGSLFPVEISLSPFETEDGMFVTAAVRDISSRKEAEDKLRLQSAALNAAANAIVITDTHDVIQWVNPAFTRLTGYSETDAIGKTPKIVRSDRHELEFYKSMREVPSSGQVWKGEVINKRKDGVEYFEEQTITPVLDRDGKVSHFIAIKEDITSRKQAEMDRANAEVELKAAFKRTNLLFDVTKIGISSQSLSSLSQEIVEKVAQDLPANRTSLIIFDTFSKRIKHFARGGPNANQIFLSVTFDELMEGLSGWAIRTGRSALSLKDEPDPRESEAVQRRRRETNCGSVLVTPLKYQNEILGTLTLINLPEEPDFTEKDVELIEAVAGQISSAIVKVTLEESLQHQNKYLTTLHQITLDLLNKMDINELLQSIVEQAAEFLDTPYCEIMLHENDKLVVRAYTRNQPFLTNDQVGRDEAFLSWKAFDTRTPVIMNDYSNWSQRRKTYNGLNISAVVSLPILSANGSIGVLDISRSKPDTEFDDFEIQAATLFAQLASLALENAKLHEAIRQEAIQDSLTGLFNRRFMQESLIKETSRAKRKGISFSVVMLDLDHLKEINDTYGHSAGDEVLRNISRVLKTKVRTGDIACRYGGDEFTLILADAKLDNARQRMEELREEISQMAIQHEGTSVAKFSLSIGIAEYPGNGTTGEELLKAADMALYRAKQAGRNRVMTA